MIEALGIQVVGGSVAIDISAAAGNVVGAVTVAVQLLADAEVRLEPGQEVVGIGGEVVSNELKDVTGTGFMWGSGSAGSTCVPAASASNDGGWYSCAYSDNLLTWFR